MGILDFFKKKNEITIKDIKGLPQEYKDMIYFLRPKYTLLTQEPFINLYTSILIGDVLYISNMDDVNNYRSWLNKSNVKNARMIDFAYDTDKGIVLKNRFGSCNTYHDYKRIIFLDIDGVLSSIPFLCKGKGFIDPENIKTLNKLKDTGAEVVISSSWGEDADKPLMELGLEIPIIGHTEHFHVDWLCRGNEIEKWLCANFGGMGTKYGVSNDDGIPYHRKHYHEEDIDYEYVILDDDTDFLLGQKDNFIHVDEQTGLTDKDVEKARKILTRQ